MSLGELLTAAGAFAIAGVIYYEGEELRASSLLSEIQSSAFYSERRKLYEDFVEMLPLDASPRERAEAFRARLWASLDLRTICDLQWATIFRLRYGLRLSLWHRGLAAEWFPQVLVCLWVMTNRYYRERDTLRPRGFRKDHALLAVTEALRVLERRGIEGGIGLQPITIWGRDEKRVVISTEVLRAMMSNLDAPFE